MIIGFIVGVVLAATVSATMGFLRDMDAIADSDEACSSCSR